MTEEWTVPHMTDLVSIVQRETDLRDLLELSRHGTLLKSAAAQFFADRSIVSSLETAERYVGSLCTYHFLQIDGEFLQATEYSSQYLAGDFGLSDLLLKCLSKNLEWTYFMPDLVSIVSDKAPIKKAGITKELVERGYSISNRATAGRYLGEILPLMSIAGVIDYSDGTATPGTRTTEEIRYYTSKNQRDLLHQLLMAERRRIPKKTFRRLYRATVKSYLPLRMYRNEIAKTQAEIEDLRAIEIIQEGETEVQDFPSKWELTDGLWKWQQEFEKNWLTNRSGIVKVVTGAGKTHLAMAIIQDMKRHHSDLRVTIIVPTIVLLDQWHRNLVKRLQISPSEIARRGGGYSDEFGTKSVLICVVNSAIRDDFIEKETLGKTHNLLIVDECHRSGAKEFRRVYKAHRDWTLGLSATPERESDNAFVDVLAKELGPIIGTYTYADALNDGIIPRFNICNYAILLTNTERRKYDLISKEIQKIVERLKYKYPQLERSSQKMEITLKVLQKQYPNDIDLFLYFQKTKERKDDIVYPAANRRKIVRNILDCVLGAKKVCDTFSSNSALSRITEDDRVIVFHEKIDEVNSLFIDLDSKEVSIYHSGFPNALNRIGLNLYQSGETRALLSVKALIEGVDVPMTNLGIIMASSSSQIQRIQSLGRVLRKAEGKDCTNLVAVYVRNSTDERIFRKGINWDKIIGKGHVTHRLWSEFGETSIDQPTPFVRTEKTISEVDETKLSVGAEYPGEFNGEIFGFDSRGRVFKKVGGVREYLSSDLSQFWPEYRKRKPQGGKVVVNEKGHVLMRTRSSGRSETVYLGRISPDTTHYSGRDGEKEEEGLEF